MTSFGSVPLLSDNISDPSFQLCRLLCIDRDNVLVCNGNELKLVNIKSSCPLELDTYVDSGNVSRCHSYSLGEEYTLDAKSLLSPDAMFQSVCTYETPGHQHQAAAVTSHGDIVICSLIKDDPQGYSFAAPHSIMRAASHSGGYGYVGLCNANYRLASCHYLSKSLVWNDMSTLAETRKAMLYSNPTCVTSCFTSPDEVGSTNPSSPVVVVSEGSNIAVFDERQNSKGGCIYRENENYGGVLWDILPLADNNRLAAAGSEKNIRIYDNRMWKTITKWRAPHKFDIIKLLPSSNNPLQLYVAGRDNEVLLCDLEPHFMSSQTQKSKSRKHDANTNLQSKEKDMGAIPPSKKQKQESGDDELSSQTLIDTGVSRDTELLPMQLPSSSKLRISHHRGIRAEFMWSGLDVSLKNDDVNDRLVGLCGHGKLYIADNANFMKLAI